MKLKNKFALAVALTAFQFLNSGGAVEAAEIDNELAVIAAEQDNGGEFLTPSQNQTSQENLSGDDKKKIIEAENTQGATVENKVADKITQPVEETVSVVEEVVNKSDNETITQPTSEQTTQTVAEKITPSTSEQTIQTVTEQTTQPTSEQTTQTVAENSPQPVGLPNPITNYASFEDLAKAVNFTPLYIPKKSGYTVNEIFSISNQIAEIRYGRRWEPEVSLQIRTYKRSDGEELKDISGVNGVKWRIDMTSGTTVYIAKINERSHVAAWASGSYTFAAHVENLSFAAFHSLVIDELVDLTTHYYTT